MIEIKYTTYAAETIRCDWCGGKIGVDTPFVVWAYISDVNAAYTRVHRECLSRMEEEAKGADGHKEEALNG